jgi:hypothetical protein
VRVLCFSALVATGAVFQSQPAVTDVAVIVDSDAPVANAGASARLREHALADVERYGRPAYFDLTASAITRVPENAGDSFRRATFAFQPPTYAGVSISFDEASEILRKNEAVRDAVIRRECVTSPDAGCGAAVHAAATTLAAETELASSRKLRHLVETATSVRPALLVLVTAGWPYRDERRIGIDAVVRELEAAGTRLVVLRVPALVAYQGLVRDASETVASRLSATFIALHDERDVERAHRALAHDDRAAPAQSLEPEPRVHEDASPVSDLPDDVLRRAAGYVARFERTFSAVIWRERYQQEDRIRRRFSASGTSFTSVAARRQLDSELLFVWLPRDATWIAVRDVIAIDGKPRPLGDRRLQALLSHEAVSMDQLRQLAAENGRFNIGQIRRTFNEPTLALLFLDDHYRHRFTFARSGEQTVNGQRAVSYEFAERARPTVIQERDRDVPVRGTLWIDAPSGRVLQTLLELADPAGRFSGRMTVQFGPHAKFDVLVPLEMRETYTSRSGEEVTAVATYSDFRRFETAGRLIS